jgi:hypothetical protein
MLRKPGILPRLELLLCASLVLGIACARGEPPRGPDSAAQSTTPPSPDASAAAPMTAAPAPVAAQAAATADAVWAQDQRAELACPLAPREASPRARLAPAEVDRAWRARLEEWSRPGFLSAWRERFAQQAPYRAGRVAFLTVEEQPGRPARIWFDARQFELPPELRAASPEQAGTLLLAFSHCFSEYPPGEPPRPPTLELWMVRDGALAHVPLGLGQPIVEWLRALPAR